MAKKPSPKKTSNTEQPAKETVKKEAAATPMPDEQQTENQTVQANKTLSPGDVLDRLSNSKDTVKTLSEIKDSIDVDKVATLIDFIVDYIEKMTPGKQHIPQKATFTQYGLYNALKTIFDADYQTFIMGMAVLLGVFDRLKNTVFGPYYVFRYLDHWPGTNEEKRTFMYMLDFISLFATTDREKAKQQIDEEKLTNKDIVVFTDTAVENIKKFISM